MVKYGINSIKITVYICAEWIRAACCSIIHHMTKTGAFPSSETMTVCIQRNTRTSHNFCISAQFLYFQTFSVCLCKLPVKHKHNNRCAHLATKCCIKKQLQQQSKQHKVKILPTNEKNDTFESGEASSSVAVPN